MTLRLVSGWDNLRKMLEGIKDAYERLWCDVNDHTWKTIFLWYLIVIFYSNIKTWKPASSFESMLSECNIDHCQNISNYIPVSKFSEDTMKGYVIHVIVCCICSLYFFKNLIKAIKLLIWLVHGFASVFYSVKWWLKWAFIFFTSLL